MPDLVVDRIRSTGTRRVADPPIDWGEFWPGWFVATEPETSYEPEGFGESSVVISRSLAEVYRGLTMRLVEVTRGYGSVICQQGKVRVCLIPARQLVTREARPVFRGATITKCEDRLFGLRAYQVVTPNAGPVRAYLDQFPDIAELLPAICDQARREFGPETELSLELYRDPEIKDEYLTLYVRQTRYAADILDRLEGVSQSFAEKLEGTSGHLLLTTDFRPPRGKNAV